MNDNQWWLSQQQLNSCELLLSVDKLEQNKRCVFCMNWTVLQSWLQSCSYNSAISFDTILAWVGPFFCETIGTRGLQITDSRNFTSKGWSTCIPKGVMVHLVWVSLPSIKFVTWVHHNITHDYMQGECVSISSRVGWRYLRLSQHWCQEPRFLDLVRLTWSEWMLHLLSSCDGEPWLAITGA